MVAAFFLFFGLAVTCGEEVLNEDKDEEKSPLRPFSNKGGPKKHKKGNSAS
jgi:hypothetical protein